ncbi:hypothetical protein IMG5_160910 [Ichthyophthirius multifiliis]|uniref:guanylate kinase n=1 Tax=Ichthyophthirius multifiliis TaxID=5932 RepID=G0R001_ICHMU|nr:hypothetical protein IMG5_160910 [Ichthyophthirius multifiliis]EGR29211.1 hypothetical protein IMG5_160910 [Ichthyophthirius multifiliis]|eukprot:XP_004030447.1 hypothetical protein IMG5_160910 [Ichthyophthirius multifiliis]
MLEKPQNVYEYCREFFSFYNIDKDKIIFDPLIISGPSGVGKGTIIKQLLKEYPNIFDFSISYTTRKAQQNETDGIEYFFVSKEEFEKEIRNQSFIEYCIFQGEYYGTHKGKLQSIIQSQKIAILEIDIEGAKKIHKQNPEWNYIYLIPPDLQQLEYRLKQLMLFQYLKYIINRQQNLEEEIYKSRMQSANQELEDYRKLGFYSTIVNEDKDQCIKEIVNFTKTHYSKIQFG